MSLSTGQKPPHPTSSNTDSESGSRNSDSDKESSSRDTAKVSLDLPISPSEDIKSYGELQLASVFHILSSIPKSMILCPMSFRENAPISLPLTSVMLQAIHQTWELPALAPTSSKQLHHMYLVQESSAAFLYSNPKPNSLVVSSFIRSKKHSSPLDKDSKRIDSFGHQFYFMAFLAVKGCNYLACMAHFIYNVLEDFNDIIPRLMMFGNRPCNFKLMVFLLLDSRLQLQNMLESSSKTFSSADALRRLV